MKSNLRLLKNFSVIDDYPIQKSFIFWVIVVLTVWLIFTIPLVLFRMKKFDMVDVFKTTKLKTWGLTFKTIYVVIFLLKNLI